MESERPLCRTVSAERLADVVAAAMRSSGTSSEHAGWVAAALVHAELSGVDDHGVALACWYADLVRSGSIAARPSLEVIERRAPVLRLDGGNGLGPVVGRWAIDEACEVAAKSGACVATVVRGNHLGALAYYVERATERGMAALLTQTTPPVMAPWGGTQPTLGNAPFAIATPTAEYPLVLDTCCAVAAKAKILQAALAGTAIPPGWALDRDGRPTTDAVEAFHGAQMPFGDHKGSGLAVMLGALAGVVSGAGEASVSTAGTARASPPGRAYFLVVVDVARFTDPVDYVAQIRSYADRVASSAPRNPSRPVRLPGQRAAQTRVGRTRRGVPIPVELMERLSELGQPSKGGPSAGRRRSGLASHPSAIDGEDDAVDE